MPVLIVAGLHVPVIPLVENGERAGATEFWHSGAICVNVGVTGGSITMSINVPRAHCPGSGVKR